MIFDVVKATHCFSIQGEGKGTCSLLFEVVPNDRYQLDIGEDYVLIGSGYHRFMATERRPVLTTVTVVTDTTIIERVKADKPICGTANFFKEGNDTPATLAIYLVVEPDVFEAMASVQINEPGAAKIFADIEELEFGGAMDGSHEIWSHSDTGGNTKPVSHFWYNVDTFWTSEGGISAANDRQTNAWLADSPNAEDRKLGTILQSERSASVAALLQQCRWLLAALLILAVVAFIRFS